MSGSNLVHIDSNSLDQALQKLALRINDIEASLPNHPAFSSLADRLSLLETSIFSSPPSSKEPSASTSFFHVVDDLRATLMKLHLDHDVHLSALQLELEKQKRAISALPTSNDDELLKQLVLAEMASRAHAIESKVDEVARTFSERLAEQAATEAEWKATFERSTMARIENIFSAIQENKELITNGSAITENRFKMQQDTINTVEDSVAYLRDRVTLIADNNTELARQLQSLEESTAASYAKLNELRDALTKHEEENHMTFQSIAHTQNKLSTNLQKQGDALDAHQSDTATKLAELHIQANDLFARSDTHTNKIDILHGQTAVLELRQSDTASIVAVHEAKIENVQTHQTKTHQLHLKLEKEVVAFQKDTRQRLDDGEKAFEGLNTEYARFRHEVMESRWAQDETNKMVAAEMKEIVRSFHALKDEINDVVADLPKFHMELSRTNANVANVRLEMRDIRAEHASAQENTTAVTNRLDDLRSISNAQFERAKVQQDELEQGHTQNNLHELKKILDGLQHVDHTDPVAVDKQLNGLALVVAQLELKHEHFRSHSTSMAEDIKHEVAGQLLQASRIISGLVRSQIYSKLLTDDSGSNDSSELKWNLRLNAAAGFAKRVHQFVEKLSPSEDNKFTIIARDVMERRVRICLEQTLAAKFRDSANSKQGRRLNNTATCISCDRPIFASSDSANQEEAIVAKTSPNGHPVDVKSVIPRRSGHTNVPPKVGAEVAHVNPQSTKEKFVYRGGFRLPHKTVKPEMDSSFASQTIHLGLTNLSQEPCLEKVALLGKCQTEAQIHTKLARPHTAPHSKSLPKLPVTPCLDLNDEDQS
ncbi:hypothetical protein AeRB84_018146 [Aphanomyces euteiches]|nr:hypothetical protein AeRB84_018146 [Aphanomyces euteiches]